MTLLVIAAWAVRWSLEVLAIPRLASHCETRSSRAPIAWPGQWGIEAGFGVFLLEAHALTRERPVHIFGLFLRRHLPQRGQRRRPCPAVLQQHDHGFASDRDITGGGARRSYHSAHGSGRLAQLGHT